VFTHTFRNPETLHGVEKNLQFFELMGITVETRRQELWWDRADERAVDAVFAPAKGQPVLALGIGSNEDKRCWPIENYAAIAEEFDGYTFVAGGPQDRTAAAELSRRLPGRLLNEDCSLTLRQSAAAMRRCDMFVGNDSAPAHLAATAGLPIVEISCHPAGGDPAHYNAPERFRPYTEQVTVLRPKAKAPCRDFCEINVAHCITNVAVADVRAAMQGLQKEKPRCDSGASNVESA
jgi:heptosyltransferase III